MGTKTGVRGRIARPKLGKVKSRFPVRKVFDGQEYVLSDIEVKKVNAQAEAERFRKSKHNPKFARVDTTGKVRKGFRVNVQTGEWAGKYGVYTKDNVGKRLALARKAKAQEKRKKKTNKTNHKSNSRKRKR